MMIQVQSFQSLLQAKIYLHLVCVIKQPVFGIAESWQKNSSHGYKEILFFNYCCEKGCQSTSLWTILRSEISKIYLSTLKSVQNTSSVEKISIHSDCRCSDCSQYLKIRFFTSRHSICIYTCIDVNDVLTFCDFTQSYCSELLMRASAWMTKGNEAWKRKRMLHATTWHHNRTTKNAHILQPTLPRVIVRAGRGGEGVNWRI